jgi:hypothetical protein
MEGLCGSSLSAPVDRLGRSGVHEDLAAGVQGEDNSMRLRIALDGSGACEGRRLSERVSRAG